MLSRLWTKKTRSSECSANPKCIIVNNFLSERKKTSNNWYNHQTRCLHWRVFENYVFFFPKKAAGDMFFVIFPLQGIFCSSPGNPGEGGVGGMAGFHRLWWHLCDAAPCGGDGGVSLFARERKKPAIPTFGVWDGWATEKEAHEWKTWWFYFEHDVDEFDILFMYVWIQILNRSSQ